MSKSEFEENGAKPFRLPKIDIKSQYKDHDHHWGHHWGQQRLEKKFWNDIRKGMEKDVADMNRNGMSSEEFWKQVWSDIHKGGYNGPDVVDDKTMREKLEKIQEEGKVLDEIWDNKCSEESVSLLWIPMMKRWRLMGASQSGQEFEERMLKKVEGRYLGSLTKDQNAEYEQMKGAGRQREFWRNHWNEIHETFESNAHHHPWSEGFHGNDGHWGGRWRWLHARKRKASFEDEPIYREFDFC